MEEFDKLFHQYEGMIKGMLRRLGIYKNYDDYYQEACIAFWKAYEHYQPEKGTFQTYAYITVKGNLQTLLNKENSYEKRFLHKLTEDKSRCFNRFERLEEEYIHSLCSGMTDNQLIWVNKYLFEGKTISEIAAEEATTTASVKSWRRQAVAKLRSRFEHG